MRQGSEATPTTVTLVDDEPTALDVLVTCSAASRTWTLAQNMYCPCTTRRSRLAVRRSWSRLSDCWMPQDLKRIESACRRSGKSGASASRLLVLLIVQHLPQI